MAGSNRLSDSGIQSGPPRDRDLLRFLRPQAAASTRRFFFRWLGREGRAEPQAGVTAPGGKAASERGRAKRLGSLQVTVAGARHSAPAILDPPSLRCF